MALLAESRREDRWASHGVTTLVLRGVGGLVVAGKKGALGIWHLGKNDLGSREAPGCDEQDTIRVLIWGLRNQVS